MMAKKKKSTKKSGAKGKSGGKKAASPFSGADRQIILFGAVLAASAGAVFAVQGAIETTITGRYAVALVSGLLTGVSGNPLWLELISKVAELFGADSIASLLPQNYLGDCFSREMIFLAAVCAMALVSLLDGLRKGRMRYEPALIIPSLGFPAMLLAIRERTNAQSFYNLFSDFFKGPYPIGFVALCTLLLCIVRLASRAEPQKCRHWLFSFAAGPFIGFWIGYLETSWVQSLFTLLLFSYIFILNEDVVGIIYSIPVAAAPLLGAKIFFLGAEMAKTPDAASCGIPWAAIAVSAAGFAAAHLFTTRLAAAIPSGPRRTLFFSTTLVFLASLMFNF